MADITLTVDVSSLADARKKLKDFQTATNSLTVNQLASGIKSLQGNIKQLVDAQRDGTIGTAAYNKGMLELKRAYEALGYSSQRATAAVRAYAQQLRDQAAAQAAARAAEQAAAAQAAAAANVARLTQSYNQLLASLNPVVAAQQRTRQTVDMLRAAVAAGAITTQQAAQALLQYRAALRAMNAANQQAALGMNRTAVMTQQAGYQVGDFFVQVQSGTNILVAFGQQATQLIGTMAMLSNSTRMIAIFSGLGVLVAIGTAIGAAMMRASGSSDTLTQSLDKTKSAADKVKETLDLLADTDLELKFGNMTDEVRSLSAAMLDLDNAAQMRNLSQLLGKLEGAADANIFAKFFSGMASGLTFGLVGQGAAASDEAAFEKLGFDMGRTQYLAYIESLKAAAESGDREGVISLFNQFMEDAGTDVSASGYAIADSIRAAAISTAELVARLNGSADAAKRLKETMEAGNRESDIIAQLYTDVAAALDKVKDDQDDIADARDKEVKSLQDQLALNTAILQFGKDSAQVAKLKAEQDREAYLQQQMTNGLYGDSLKLVMDAYDANAKVTAELAASEDKAKGLADALKDAASAMASLLNMGSLEAKLAGLVAEVNAIETGANRVAAGYVASERTKAAQQRDEALAAGGIPQDLVNKAYRDRVALIDRIGETTTTRDAALEAQREADRKGRSGGKARESQLEQLIQGLMTERETLESWRSEQLDLLQQYNETELSVIGGQAEAKFRIEQEYSKRLVDLKAAEKQIVQSQAQSMYSALGGFLDQFAGKSKAAAIASIALNKALSIAQAIQNTSVAFTKALTIDPTGALAARVALMGKVQVGLIAATGLAQAASAGRGSSGGLSGGGSPSGSDATMSSNVTAAPQRVIIEGIDRNSLISGEQLSNIFEALYKENENRGFVFEVAR